MLLWCKATANKQSWCQQYSSTHPQHPHPYRHSNLISTSTTHHLHPNTIQVLSPYPSTYQCPSTPQRQCIPHIPYLDGLANIFLISFVKVHFFCLNEWSVRLPLLEIGESEPLGFEPWSSQTNDIEIDTCYFLARRSASLG